MVPKIYTIGEVSRLSGVPVRRVRFYADEGLLRPVSRSDGGYRLFSGEDLARIGMIRMLRDAGLGLEAIRAVLLQQRPLSDVMALRLAEIETHIRSQRRIAAALRAALRTPEPTPQDLQRVWSMTSLSLSERRAVVQRFLDEVTTDISFHPYWKDRILKLSTRTLPDEPSSEQIDAWIELTAMFENAEFVLLMRNDAKDAFGPLDFPAFQEIQRVAIDEVGAALNAGSQPESESGQAIAGRFLSGWAAALNTECDEDYLVRMRRKFFSHQPNTQRFWALIAIVGGVPARPEPTPEWLWLDRAIKNFLHYQA